MKRLIVYILWALTLGVFGADSIVTLKITVTNQPAAGATLTVNGDARTWASSIATPSTQVLINTNSAAASATNLYAHASLYGYAGPLVIGFSSSNIVTMRGQVNGAVTASASSGWASFTYVTNSVTNLFTVRVPAAAEAQPVRRLVADELVATIRDNALTNAFSDATPALTNHVNRGGAQTISGAKIWTGSNSFSSIITTGLVNQGSAISSLGSATDSQQFGKGALATNVSTLAVGSSAKAGGDSSTALGVSSYAIGDYSIALGAFATASTPDTIAMGSSANSAATNAVAIGSLAAATGNDSVVVGASATDQSFTNTVVIGSGAKATAHNQWVLGSSVHTVKVPGKIDGPTITNATYNGTIGILSGGTISGSTITGSVVHATGGTLAGITTTNATHNGTIGTLSGGTITGATVTNATVRDATTAGTTRLQGIITLQRNTVSSLANGSNAGVDPTTYSFLRITSGPSAAFSINGIAGGVDGRILYLYNATGQNMTLAHDSGIDPTAANRIKSNTGADLVSTGNATATLIYDGAESRWIVMSWNP